MHQCFYLDGEHYTSLNRLVKGKLSAPNDILILVKKTSIYIHIPFCERRCRYCDFNTYSGIDYLMQDYVKAVCREIKWMGSYCPEDVLIHTIYFGGGTPSLLPIELSEQILNQIHQNFHLASTPEITLEANPGTIDFEKIKGYHQFGVNRLSLGAQSFNDQELKLLGRIHNIQQIIEGVELARRAGFSQINLDLMFGLPDQSINDWEKTLFAALQLDVEHLSLYGLTIEPGTVFGEWLKKGKISDIDDDLAADCYELACDLLDQNHYEHYEISNWAKRDTEGNLLTCRHNLQYWKNLPYFGFGAGAHGFFNNMRIANVYHPDVYIKKINQGYPLEFPLSPATIESHYVTKSEEMNDTLMLGLRLLIEGVGVNDFYQRFGKDLTLIFGDKIQELINKGLLEWVEAEQKRLRLTPRAYLLGNLVFREFV